MPVQWAARLHDPKSCRFLIKSSPDLSSSVTNNLAAPEQTNISSAHAEGAPASQLYAHSRVCRWHSASSLHKVASGDIGKEAGTTSATAETQQPRVGLESWKKLVGFGGRISGTRFSQKDTHQRYFLMNHTEESAGRPRLRLNEPHSGPERRGNADASLRTPLVCNFYNMRP